MLHGPSSLFIMRQNLLRSNNEERASNPWRVRLLQLPAAGGRDSGNVNPA
jgi:hypothetical protein